MLIGFSAGKDIASPLVGTFKMNSDEFAEHRLIGYARVSASDKELALQIDSLLSHGIECENIFCDKLSGLKLTDLVLRVARKVCDEVIHS